MIQFCARHYAALYGQSLLRCLELSLHLHRGEDIAETRLAMIDDHQCVRDGDEKGIGGNIVKSRFCAVDMALG